MESSVVGSISIGQNVEINYGAMHPIANGVITDVCCDLQLVEIEIEGGGKEYVDPDFIRRFGDGNISPIGIFLIG